VDRIFIQSANVLREAVGVTATASSTKPGYGGTIALSVNPNAGWMPGTCSGTVTYTIDLKAAYAVKAWGLLNHTVYSSGGGTVTILYGTADDGTTFDQTADVIATLGKPEYEPHVMGYLSGVPAKRYWRLSFTGCTNLWFVGGIYLGGTLSAILEAPDDIQDVPDDTVATSETSGGHDRRHAFGNTVTLTNMVWKRTSDTIRSKFRDIHTEQEGRGGPVLLRDHKWTFGTMADPFPCRLVTIERLNISEVRPGSQWQIRLAVKDLMLT
jgi:hypothetical protein